MARSKNGHGKLEDSVLSLMQHQAALMQNQTAFMARAAETDRELLKLERRIDNVLAVLAEHGRILDEHTRILHALPDLVRDRFGFRAPEPPK